MMKTFKIYSLSNFQMYNRVLLTIVPLLYATSPWLIYFPAGSLSFNPLGFLCKSKQETSLVAQWLRIHLPMQWTRVRALVREDPKCRGATKPVHHNYWACGLEPESHNYWAHVPQLL